MYMEDYKRLLGALLLGLLVGLVDVAALEVVAEDT